MANLTLDIIQLARYLLVPKGRLVFFIPTITEDWDEVDLPVVEGMRELKIGTGSVQDFHSWGRRVSLMTGCWETAADQIADNDGKDGRG
jgi:tRNA (guanine10-N2)-methyltransferase